MVVGPDRVAPERELVLTAQQTLAALLPVQDDVAIAYRDRAREWSTFLRWANQGDQEVKYADGLYRFAPPALVPWGDGVFVGSRVIKPGDKSLFETRQFFHDNDAFGSNECKAISVTPRMKLRKSS